LKIARELKGLVNCDVETIVKEKYFVTVKNIKNNFSFVFALK
jgi:hypothetical protein